MSENWEHFYFLHPEPERVVEEVRRASTLGRLKDPLLSSPFVTFVSRVMAAHPERISDWLDALEDLPQPSLEALYHAVWLSDTHEGRAQIAIRGLDPRYTEAPPDVLDLPIENPCQLDILWEYYFATGDVRAVRRIVDALEFMSDFGAAKATAGASRTEADKARALRDAIFQAASWSLESILREHPPLQAFCGRLVMSETLSTNERCSLAIVLSRVAPDAWSIVIDPKTRSATIQHKTPGAPADPTARRPQSKYLDNNSYATNPGGCHLSLDRLRELEPELLAEGTMKCSGLCSKDHPTAELRERIDEHLMQGDSRAALVMSVDPLLVAAFSSDLDAAVLLRFPTSFVAKYGLQVGSRLLTVNTYGDRKGERTGKPFYAVDLLPGSERSAWSNFQPYIADFFSDDRDRIETRKRAIDEAEWTRAERHARTRIERMGAHTAREGKPTAAGTPVLIRSRQHFQPIEFFSATDRHDPQDPKPPVTGVGASLARPQILVPLVIFLYLVAKVFLRL